MVYTKSTTTPWYHILWRNLESWNIHKKPDPHHLSLLKILAIHYAACSHTSMHYNKRKLHFTEIHLFVNIHASIIWAKWSQRKGYCLYTVQSHVLKVITLVRTIKTAEYYNRYIVKHFHKQNFLFLQLYNLFGSISSQPIVFQLQLEP